MLESLYYIPHDMKFVRTWVWPSDLTFGAFLQKTKAQTDVRFKKFLTSTLTSINNQKLDQKSVTFCERKIESKVYYVGSYKPRSFLKSLALKVRQILFMNSPDRLKLEEDGI